METLRYKLYALFTLFTQAKNDYSLKLSQEQASYHIFAIYPSSASLVRSDTLRTPQNVPA